METPTVGPPLANQPVILHLLSPAKRPLAITQDLASFWGKPYLDLRAEVRNKYSKHPWPDDPASAMPTRLSTKALRDTDTSAVEVAEKKNKNSKRKVKKKKR